MEVNKAWPSISLRNEADDIAPCIAAEAVIQAGCGVDDEGGGCLFMEGAQGRIVRALLVDHDAIGGNHVYEVMVLLDGLDPRFGYLHATTSLKKKLSREKVIYFLVRMMGQLLYHIVKLFYGGENEI